MDLREACVRCFVAHGVESGRENRTLVWYIPVKRDRVCGESLSYQVQVTMFSPE